jgi:HK97 family phage portal protein
VNKKSWFKKLDFKNIFKWNPRRIGIVRFPNGSIFDNNYDSNTIYSEISAVGHAVDMIAEKVSEILPVIKDSNGEIVSGRDSSRLLELLYNPSPLYSRRSFLVQVATEYLLYNNAFIYLANYKNALPSEIEPIYLKSVSITETYNNKKYLVNSTGVNSRYNGEYNLDLQNGRILSKIDIGELLHISGYRSNNELFSKSKLIGLTSQASIMSSAMNSLESALLKGFSAGAIIGVDTKNNDVFEQFAKDVKTHFSGSSKSGDAMVLKSSSFKADYPKMTNKDMQTIENMESAKKSIYERFEIPEPLINSSAQTYNNYQTAMYALYDNAVLPLFNLIYGALSEAMRDRNILKNSQSISYDPTSIPALKIRDSDEIETLKSTGALSINELRAKMGYQPVVADNADTPVGLLSKQNLIQGNSVDQVIKSRWIDEIKESGMTEEEARQAWDVSKKIIRNG